MAAKKRKKNKSAKNIATGRHLSGHSKNLEKLLNFLDTPLIQIAALVIVGTIFILYYTNIFDDADIWWQLKYGEHYVENFTWHIDHTQYSWSPVDSEWFYGTWLGSVILYLVYKTTGFVGLSILQWAMIFSLGAVFAVYVRTCKLRFSTTHVAGLLLSIVALNSLAIYLKPELFTLLFFNLIVMFYFLSKTFEKNYFIFYPIIFLFWVNIHGGWLIGLFFITLIFLFEYANYLYIQNNEMPGELLKKFAIFGILSYVAVIINPDGILYPVNIALDLLSKDSEKMGAIRAMRPLWEFLFPERMILRIYHTAWTLVFMEVVLLLQFLYVFLKKRYFDITLIGISIIFFIFGMSMIRASIFFPVFWMFTWQYVIYKNNMQLNRKVLPIALIILIALPLYIYLKFFVIMSVEKAWFGNKNRDHFPMDACEFVLENKIPGPIMNDYRSGAYLIWGLYPDYKVFIDPRFTLYLEPGTWDDYLRILSAPSKESIEALHKKYKFKSAIIDYINYFNLGAEFLKLRDWSLVYIDQTSLIFVRRDERSLELKASYMKLFSDTSRFKHLENSIALARLFQIYATLKMVPQANEIINIFEKNIKGPNSMKATQLRQMRRHMKQFETKS